MLRRARLVILLSGAFAALCLLPILGRLGINTDTSQMISDRSAWKLAEREMERVFPDRGESIVVVIDAGTPEIAARVRDELMRAIEGRRDLFSHVEAPDSDPFFARNGLLYLDADDLELAVGRIERGTPALATLAADKSVGTLAGVVSAALAGGERGAEVDPSALLLGIGRAAEAAGRGEVREMSWGGLAGAGGPSGAWGAQPRRVLVAWPVIDHQSGGFPSGPAMEAIRGALAGIEVEDERGYSARLTGAAVLNTDELKSAARGAWSATAIALGGVLLALYVGLASFRLVLAAGVTLLAGLLGTAAFAALTVGQLNLVSVAFAVLYVGLGIDYAIHVCLRYRECCVAGASHARATLVALRETAPSLAICAVTTSAAFFAFIPTEFKGVSELGVIAGGGMFISLLVSVTLLPALLYVFGRPTRYSQVREPRAVDWLIELPVRWRWGVWAGAVGLAVVAVLYAAPRAEFDRNRMNLQDPTLESVETFRELLATSQTPPMTLSVIVGDESEAERVGGQLSALESVRRVVGLGSLIPAEQGSKLGLIGQAGESVGGVLGVGWENRATPDAEQELVALEALGESLRLAGEAGAPYSEAARAAAERVEPLAADLWARWGDGDRESVGRALAAFRQSVFGGLDATIESLRVSLGATEVTPETLPPRIRDRWIAADGRLRLEIVPAQDLTGNEALSRFVREVETVAPLAVGSAAGTLRAGDTMARAFTQALLTALVAVVVIVGVLTRRVLDVWLVMAPLVLAGLLTVLGTVVLDQPFNFANMIALPLMLGVGVDSGIHIVHRARTLGPGEAVLASSTARAVLFSSLTTVFSFGTLALSSHRGMQSMGSLLTIAMVVLLVCTLVVLPAMLPRKQGGGAQRR